MKVREIINNNANEFTATTYEDNNKIIVIKSNTYNYYDNSTDEKFVFNTIKEYEDWKKEQNWIDPNKIKIIHNFKKVI